MPLLESERRARLNVATLKLDTFCAETGLIPTVIKIDVEGAEGMVLRGALEVLRQFRPALVVSMHPYWLPALPFELDASITATEDGKVRLHADNIKSAHVPIKGFLHFLGEDLSKLIHDNQGHGIEVEGDDIMISFWPRKDLRLRRTSMGASVGLKSQTESSS